jgi:penicillin amidase
VRPVAPTHDAELIHSWVTRPAAAFWGMADKDLEEVTDIYRYIDDQPHLAAYFVSVGGVPLGLFQTYDPFIDEIGGYYDRQPGDVGLHLFLRDGPRRAGRTTAITARILQWLFSDPERLRIVMEPDAANERSLRFFAALGAIRGPRAELPHKTAQFFFLTRQSPVVAAALERPKDG